MATSNAARDEQTPQPTPTIIHWRCPNCGQTIFTDGDDAPPDLCHFCRDMTTWQRLTTQNSEEEATD